MTLTDPAPRDAARTRQRLLEVARERFSRHGFDGTSVREIAGEAGVSANLITRYFGGKAGLFAEATTVDLRVADLLEGPFERLGHRLAAGVVERWDAAGGTDPLLMMLRSAGTSDEAAAALSAFFERHAQEPLRAHLTSVLGGGARVEERVAAVSALIMGVVTARYVMRSQPLADAASDALRRWLGDGLQRLLDEPGPPPLS